MDKKVTLKINNVEVTVPAGTKILDAAKQAGFNIPTLCYMKDLCNDGSCRICVVEVKGARNLVASCSATVSEGMEVFTNTPKVRSSRKTTIELMLSNHDKRCLSCVRSGNCELQTLSNEYGCDAGKYDGIVTKYNIDEVTPHLVRDNNKCILCRRCVSACKKIEGVGVIGANRRGFSTSIGCAFDKDMASVACVACGQCINVCPTGALRERDSTDDAFKAIFDPDKYVIVGTAPAVRVALGEEFGYPIGTDVEGQMVAALRALGVDKVFDVNMTADLTIMEEGTEFLNRLNDQNATLPMITSCSPGWIRYIEFNYPELLGHLSTCKSPQQMFGAVMKTYFAEKMGIDPQKIVVISVMPCIAKKSERLREHQNAAGVPDVDVVITTRELARMIKTQGIDFTTLKPAEYDNPLGEGSSAGLLFGTTGGVMEAALRTVSEVVTGKTLDKLDFKAIRGNTGIKKASLTIGDKKLKVCVVHTLANAKIVLEEIKSGKADYQFVEVMTCPGGCVNGGGQPIQPSHVRNHVDVVSLRAKAIYEKDKKSTLRKSHENPIIKTLYTEYFEKPNSHKAHKILHTKYKARNKY